MVVRRNTHLTFKTALSFKMTNCWYSCELLSLLSADFRYALNDNGGEKDGKVVPSLSGEKGSSSTSRSNSCPHCSWNINESRGLTVPQWIRVPLCIASHKATVLNHLIPQVFSSSDSPDITNFSRV